jgi:hypothetical protein
MVAVLNNFDQALVLYLNECWPADPEAVSALEVRPA